MAIIDSSEETTMADGEGTDGADKPPHGGKATIYGISNQLNASLHITQQTTDAVPLPPPEASAYDKQPGHTRGDLKKLSFTPISPAMHKTSSTTGSSEDDYGQSPSSSLPSSRAPSRPGSRAPSMSGGTSGGKLGLTTVHLNGFNGKTVTPQRRPSESDSTSPFLASTVMPNQARPGKPPSVHSDSGGSKFTLKDLLASGPKLTRKTSQRSNASSRVSDSDAGSTDGGKARSRSDSVASLTQKYGVCQKVAIGKGATSVVRLAHKWDRTEEKLYAVKVSLHLSFMFPRSIQRHHCR
jgi:protein-serine/threonine kinase